MIMKTVFDCINEELVNYNNFKPIGQDAEDIKTLFKVISKLDNKDNLPFTFSLNNNTQMKKVYNIAKNIIPDFLKIYHIKTPKNLSEFMWSNAKILKKYFDVSRISNFNEIELMRKYNIYKKSADFQDGELFDIDSYNPKEDGKNGYRILVIYDYNNPTNLDTVYQYKLYGKRGHKDIEQAVNNHKINWKIKANLDYFDARPILAKNYIKKNKSELINAIEFF